MPPRKDITGNTYNELTAISFSHVEDGRAFWLFRCSCGTEKILKAKPVVAGKTRSCGHLLKTNTRRKDITGNTYGLLTPLMYSHSTTSQTGRTAVFWFCHCECGTITVKGREELETPCSYVRSCGCLDNISGQVFGRLTALYPLPELGSARGVLWFYICDCGTEVVHNTDQINRGEVRSCGCLQREAASKSLMDFHSSGGGKGENHHRWKGGITELYHAIRTCQEYLDWRKAVFKRDWFKCQDCGSKKSGSFHAHHLMYLSTIVYSYNITTIEEARACPALWDIDNGVTLCKDCHHSRHKKDGYTLKEDHAYV
jgi:hypothetical protein